MFRNSSTHSLTHMLVSSQMPWNWLSSLLFPVDDSRIWAAPWPKQHNLPGFHFIHDQLWRNRLNEDSEAPVCLKFMVSLPLWWLTQPSHVNISRSWCHWTFLLKSMLSVLWIQSCCWSSTALGPQASYLSSLNLFPHLYNENNHGTIDWIKGEYN